MKIAKNFLLNSFFNPSDCDASFENEGDLKNIHKIFRYKSINDQNLYLIINKFIINKVVDEYKKSC